jgi:hypothetical protein
MAAAGQNGDRRPAEDERDDGGRDPHHKRPPGESRARSRLRFRRIAGSGLACSIGGPDARAACVDGRPVDERTACGNGLRPPGTFGIRRGRYWPCAGGGAAARAAQTLPHSPGRFLRSFRAGVAGCVRAASGTGERRAGVWITWHRQLSSAVGAAHGHHDQQQSRATSDRRHLAQGCKERTVEKWLSRRPAIRRPLEAEQRRCEAELRRSPKTAPRS